MDTEDELYLGTEAEVEAVNNSVPLLIIEPVSQSEETQLVKITGDSKDLINIEAENKEPNEIIQLGDGIENILSGENFELNHSYEEEINVKNPKHIETNESLCDNFIAVETVTPEKKTQSTECADEMSKQIIEAAILETPTVVPIQIECKTQHEEERLQPATISQQSFGEDWEILESKEKRPKIPEDVQSIEGEKQKVNYNLVMIINFHVYCLDSPDSNKSGR